MKVCRGSWMPALAVTLGILAVPTHAATITQTYLGSLPATLTGTLPNQDTALLLNFTLPMAGDLSVSTSSYAGGGFQTNLLLFDSGGGFIAAGTPAGMPDPGTGIAGDQMLMASGLAAGAYTIALSDFLLNQSPTATNLSDGFDFNLGNGTTFVDVLGNTRTANYSLTIGSSADIPEPSTMLLALPVLAWLGVRARREARKRLISNETKG